MLVIKSLSKIIFLFSITITIANCTRPVEETKESSKVSFAFPATAQTFNNKLSGKVDALSLPTSAKLSHVSISVTGSGIAGPLLLNWDACRNCPMGTSVAPAQFEMNIPSGPGRLIQVMLVYQDPDSSKMLFYYGDAPNVEVQGAVLTVPVNMNALNTGTVIEGMVAGRYINAYPDAGPTGVVEMKYIPAGRPPMVVATTEIVNGWFNFFMLSGIQFQYVVRDTGEILWGGPVSLDDTRFAYATNDTLNILRFFAPDHVFASERFGFTSDEKSSAKIAVWGYWGSETTGAINTSVSAKRVCLNSASFSGTNKYEIFRTNSLGAAGSGVGTGLTLTRRLAGDTNHYPVLADLLSNGSSAPTISEIAVNGGLTASTSCGAYSSGSPNLFNNFLRIDIDTQINTESKDNMAGISPPYVLNDAGQIFTMSASGGFKVMSGNLIPGTAGSGYPIDYFRVYKATGFDSSDNVYRPSCPEIVGNLTQFVSAQSSPSAYFSPASDVVTINTNIPDTSGYQTATVVCPFKNNMTVGWGGVFTGSKNFGENIATSVDIKSGLSLSAAVLKYSNSVCTPLFVKGFSGTNPAVFTTSGTANVTVSAGAGNYVLSLNQDCSSALQYSISVTLNPGERGFLVYIKSSSATETLNISGVIPTAQNFALAVNPGTPSATISAIEFLAPLVVKRGECFQALAIAKDNTGNIADLDSSSFPTNPTITATGGGSVYDDSSCSTIKTGLSFPYSPYKKTSNTIWVRAPTTTGTFIVTTTTPSSTVSFQVIN